MGARCSATRAAADAVVDPAGARVQAQAPPQQEEEAMSPKPSLDDASSSSEPRRRPTWCAPEAVMGEWRTKYGVYSITLDDDMHLVFQENNLHGVLRLKGEWYTAQIHDSSTMEDKLFGYLRLRREGEIIRSCFKAGAEDSWDNSGSIEGRPLPYLRVGARGAAEAAAEAEGGEGRPWEQTTCCICFEALDNCGDDFAELRCHHMYHKSCIHSWFERNGSCPLRCTHP